MFAFLKSKALSRKKFSFSNAIGPLLWLWVTLPPIDRSNPCNHHTFVLWRTKILHQNFIRRHLIFGFPNDDSNLHHFWVIKIPTSEEMLHSVAWINFTTRHIMHTYMTFPWFYSIQLFWKIWPLIGKEATTGSYIGKRLNRFLLWKLLWLNFVFKNKIK